MINSIVLISSRCITRDISDTLNFAHGDVSSIFGVGKNLDRCQNPLKYNNFSMSQTRYLLRKFSANTSIWYTAFRPTPWRIWQPRRASHPRFFAPARTSTRSCTLDHRTLSGLKLGLYHLRRRKYYLSRYSAPRKTSVKRSQLIATSLIPLCCRTIAEPLLSGVKVWLVARRRSRFCRGVLAEGLSTESIKWDLTSRSRYTIRLEKSSMSFDDMVAISWTRTVRARDLH